MAFKSNRRGMLKTDTLRALKNINVQILKGKALALVGESGSGKSTCAKLFSRVLQPTQGRVLLDDIDANTLQTKKDVHRYRRRVQMIFQDPFASLNPVWSIEHHIARPLLLHHAKLEKMALKKKCTALLETVGLEPALEMLQRFPHELSGGQRQRVAIARALAVEPDFILADEPTSMLDVSLRLGILNLLAKLKRDQGIGFLYITHDITSARYFGDDIAVMYQGQIVETGNAKAVTDNPKHAYTQQLIKAIPNPESNL